MLSRDAVNCKFVAKFSTARVGLQRYIHLLLELPLCSKYRIRERAEGKSANVQKGFRASSCKEWNEIFLQSKRHRLPSTRGISSTHKGPFVTAMEATSETVQHDKETRKVPSLESAAVNRLIDAILNAEEDEYGSNNIVKAFAHLDRVVLGGRLRDNVCVQRATD